MSISVPAARTAALFTSPLQPSAAPDERTIAEAIRDAVRAFGTRGCAAHVAQEYGDHPDEAAGRMRWVRSLLPDPRGGTP